VTAELFSQLVEQPFYEDLRTQQQLGYLVFSGRKGGREGGREEERPEVDGGPSKDGGRKGGRGG